MSKDLSHIENKLIALRRVSTGLEKELAEIKASKPVPVNRNFKKNKRIVNIAAFYMKRNIS